LPQGRDLWLLWPVRHQKWPDHVFGWVPRLLCSGRDALQLYLSLQISHWVELVCWCSNAKLILWRIYQLVLMLVALILAMAIGSLMRIYLRRDCIVNPILVPRVRWVGIGEWAGIGRISRIYHVSSSLHAIKLDKGCSWSVVYIPAKGKVCGRFEMHVVLIADRKVPNVLIGQRETFCLVFLDFLQHACGNGVMTE
jgi:hypothetical protein